MNFMPRSELALPKIEHRFRVVCLFEMLCQMTLVLQVSRRSVVMTIEMEDKPKKRKKEKKGKRLKEKEMEAEQVEGQNEDKKKEKKRVGDKERKEDKEEEQKGGNEKMKKGDKQKEKKRSRKQKRKMENKRNIFLPYWIFTKDQRIVRGNLFILMQNRCHSKKWKVPYKDWDELMKEWEEQVKKREKRVIQGLLSYSHILACYKDTSGLKFAVERSHAKKAKDYIKKYFKKFPVFCNYAVFPYKSANNMHETAYTSLKQASAGDRKCLLTGIFGGHHMHEIAVTAGHLVDKVPCSIELSGNVQARCVVKEKVVKVDGKIFTADIALLNIRHTLGSSSVDLIKYNEIEIKDRRFKRRLSKGEGNSFLPGTEVWMLDQKENLKIGIIWRFLVCDKESELYNVIQIVRKNSEKSFSKPGDSGGCIFLPPSDNSDVVDVIGMITSTMKYDNQCVTNAVLLGKVLPHIIKNLDPGFKVPSYLAKDKGLPSGVNFSEGLEFVESYVKVDNIDCKNFPCESNGLIESTQDSCGNHFVLAPVLFEAAGNNVSKVPDSGLGLGTYLE